MLDDLSLFQAKPAESGSLDIWFKALSSPKKQTYQQIIDYPDASIGKALYWLFLAGGFGGLLGSLVQTAFNTNSFFGLSSFQVSEQISSSAIIWSFLGTVLFAIGVPLITIINTGLIQLVARVFGVKPNYSKLLFAFAAYQAPLGLLICILGGIPTLGCIALPMAIYWLFLSVQVIRTVCEIKAGKAVICSLSPFGFGAALGFCTLVSLLATTIKIV